MAASVSKHSLLCIGHPLLDMQVTQGEALLRKYDLEANGAILAEDKHLPLYDEIAQEYEATYIAGGAAQNTARGAAYALPPDSVVYLGCVGDDELAEQLKAANRREGLHEIYQVKKGERTGACAVIITGHHRSLVTALRTARQLDHSHIASPSVAPFVDAAKVFYVEGYILSHAADLVLNLSQKSSIAGKIFALNFSAPYIPQVYTTHLHEIIPYCDIIISNEAEAESWATANKLPKTDLPSIAQHIALLPKANSTHPRIVVLTHGAESTVWVSSATPDTHRVHPVHRLRDEEIVDTNAAGDAFAGGFLAAYVSGRDVGECVEAGHRLAGVCVGQVGPQYKWPKVAIL